MSDLPLQNIFTRYRKGKIDGNTVIKYLISGIENHGDKCVLNNKKSIKCLLEIYISLSARKDENLGSFLKLLEISVSRSFVSEYKLVPHDAIILGLLQLFHNHIIFSGDNDGWGGGEFSLYFKSEQGYIREIRCWNVIPNFRIMRHFPYLKILKITDLESHRPDFRGLRDFKNLEYLELNYLEFKSIEDLREIKELTNLQELHIANSRLNEIKYLQKLENLERLSLIGGEEVGWKGDISELKGLNNLVNLKYLALSYNKISEIKGLDNLVNLEYLALDNNRILEIKGIDNLTNLREIYLEGNLIPERELNNFYDNFHSS